MGRAGKESSQQQSIRIDPVRRCGWRRYRKSLSKSFANANCLRFISWTLAKRPLKTCGNPSNHAKLVKASIDPSPQGLARISRPVAMIAWQKVTFHICKPLTTTESESGGTMATLRDNEAGGYVFPGVFCFSVRANPPDSRFRN